MQKVNYCKLSSGGKPYSSIDAGVLITVGVAAGDTVADCIKTAKKLVNMRIFKDDNDKLNLSLLDVGGDCMVVSNFTLNARIASGTRADYSHGADMNTANTLYLELANQIKLQGVRNVATGVFRTHMHILCELDGPNTYVYDTREHVTK